MIQAKKIAIVLGAVAAGLGLLAAGQYLGLGTGYSLAELQPEADDGPARVAVTSEPIRMNPWVDYGLVLSRPLFNESRAPEIEESAPAESATATQPLTLALTGVIITGSMQLALVTDTTKGETERVRVGQPLTGERAGWTLIELKPRAAVFEGDGLGRQELELTVDTRGAAPAVAAPQMPPPSPAMPNPTGQLPLPTVAAVTPPAGQPASAEEIRRRIEERRRQLREEAQKMLQQNNSQ